MPDAFSWCGHSTHKYLPAGTFKSSSSFPSTTYVISTEGSPSRFRLGKADILLMVQVFQSLGMDDLGHYLEVAPTNRTTRAQTRSVSPTSHFERRPSAPARSRACVRSRPPARVRAGAQQPSPPPAPVELVRPLYWTGLSGPIHLFLSVCSDGIHAAKPNRRRHQIQLRTRRLSHYLLSRTLVFSRTLLAEELRFRKRRRYADKCLIEMHLDSSQRFGRSDFHEEAL